MRTLSRALGIGLTAAMILGAARVQAALTAYDGFNYPTSGTSVVGQADGGVSASFGWNGGWTDNSAQTNVATQGPVYVNSTGLTYTKGTVKLRVSGGKVEQLDEDTYLPYRTLTTPVGGTGDLGATQSTVWVS